MSTFNEAAYLAANPDVAAAVKAKTFATGWQHWSTQGQVEGRLLAPAGYSTTTNGVTTTFNEAAYLANNYDVAKAVAAGTFTSGWQHYNNQGRTEGRSFAGVNGFDENAYLANNPDVAVVVHKGLDPYYASGLAHWIHTGQAEAAIGRTINPPANYTTSGFNEQAYLAANPDVAAAVKAGTIATGWSHFKAYSVNGVVAGRLNAPVGYDGLATVNLSATNSAQSDAYGFDTTYNIAAGNYSVTIKNFNAGDHIHFNADALVSVTRDTATQTDGIQQVVVTDPTTQAVTTITLIGLSAAQDGALWTKAGATDGFNAVFGAGTLV